MVKTPCRHTETKEKARQPKTQKGGEYPPSHAELPRPHRQGAETQKSKMGGQTLEAKDCSLGCQQGAGAQGEEGVQVAQRIGRQEATG